LPDMTCRAWQRVMASIALFPAVYALTLMWWIPEGDKYIPGMVVVVLVFHLIGQHLHNEKPLMTHLGGARLLVLIWLYVTYCSIVYLWKGDSWTELRAMLAMAIYFTVFRSLKLSGNFCKAAVAVSALGFLVLTWFFFLSGSNRVGGFINPIPYATALGAVLLVVFSLALWGEGKISKLVFSILSVSLFSALFMTQTRGVIVPAVFLGAALLLIYAVQHRKGMITGVLLIMFFSVITFLGNEIFRDRINQSLVELNAISKGDKSGSMGLRMQMWASSVGIWSESPIFGVGNSHKEILSRMHDEGEISDELIDFAPSHYHNQYLDILIKKGVVGLVLFLMTIVVLCQVVMYTKHEVVRFGVGSAILLYLLSGLSDVPFRHPSSLYLFFSIILIFVSTPIDNRNEFCSTDKGNAS